jgi:hypothetical protein
MFSRISYVLGTVVALSALTFVSVAVAGDKVVAAPAPVSVVGISRVTWSLVSPGGVGTFRVTVTSTGPVRSGAVWVQARSPGAPTLQGPVGAKPGYLGGVGTAGGTANGRCYDVVLAMEPDSSGAGIVIDPKNSTRRVCLDPDGAGIFN